MHNHPYTTFQYIFLKINVSCVSIYVHILANSGIISPIEVLRTTTIFACRLLLVVYNQLTCN